MVVDAPGTATDRPVARGPGRDLRARDSSRRFGHADQGHRRPHPSGTNGGRSRRAGRAGRDLRPARRGLAVAVPDRERKPRPRHHRSDRRGVRRRGGVALRDPRHRSAAARRVGHEQRRRRVVPDLARTWATGFARGADASVSSKDPTPSTRGEPGWRTCSSRWATSTPRRASSRSWAPTASRAPRTTSPAATRCARAPRWPWVSATSCGARSSTPCCIPDAGRAATIGTMAYHGAVDRYLGILALALRAARRRRRAPRGRLRDPRTHAGQAVAGAHPVRPRSRASRPRRRGRRRTCRRAAQPGPRHRHLHRHDAAWSTRPSPRSWTCRGSRRARSWRRSTSSPPR